MSTSNWPCGMQKSNNNAFTGACLEDRPAPILRAKSGPKPGALLDRRGNATVNLAPRRNTLEIFPSDWAKTTRILRGGI
jgi:hypothetical protein